MKHYTLNDKIGEIVVELPQAAELFKSHQIDYCCGGHRPLSEAIQEQALDGEALLGQLTQLKTDVEARKAAITDYRLLDPEALVEHILVTHHSFLWANLPILSELTTKILRVHGLNHPELSKVHKLFHLVKMELEEHLAKEENIQYPAIQAYFKSKDLASLHTANQVTLELESEHTAAGNVLKELRQTTQNFTVPQDGCGTYHKTYELLETMESDIFQHIHLENNILFPKLRQLEEGSR